MADAAAIHPTGSEPCISSPTHVGSCRSWVHSPRGYMVSKRLAELSAPPIRSSSEQRPETSSIKPARPTHPQYLTRAMSAENSRQTRAWAPNNSPCGDVSAGMQTSSELSLCSSVGKPTYDQLVNSPDGKTSDAVIMNYGQAHAIALYDFDTRVEGDLQFRNGDMLMLHDVVDENWYRGRSVRTGQIGIFPMNHVEVRIPLSSGLYTGAQPKPRLIKSSLSYQDYLREPDAKSEVNTSGSINGSGTVGKPTPIGHSKPVAMVHRHPLYNSVSASSSPARDACMTNGSQSSLPRRPARVRVASLNVKYDAVKAPLEKFFKGPTNNSTTELGRPSPTKFFQKLKPVSSITFPLPARARNSVRPEQCHVSPDSANSPQISRTSTPSIVQTMRPKLQTAVSQLAQSLEQRGVTITRMSHLPAGAKSIFPESFKVPGSDKSRRCEEQPNSPSQTPDELFQFPTQNMVETPLVAIARAQSLRQRKETRHSSQLEAGFASKEAPAKLTNQQQEKDQPQSLPNQKTSFPAPFQPWNTESRGSSTERYTTKSEIQIKSSDSNLPNTANQEIIHYQPNFKPTTFDSQWLFVMFDFDGLADGDLAIKCGAVIRTEQALPSNSSLPDQWLTCSDWFGRSGLVPSNYLRRILAEDEFNSLLAKRPRAKAMYEFKAEADNDLSIHPGEDIYLMEAVNENWFRGELVLTGQQGIFPSTFVQVDVPL